MQHFLGLAVKFLVPRFQSKSLIFIQHKSMSIKNVDRLVWVDCEMTGLNIDQDRLLEIAVVLTDGDFKQLDQIGPIVIQSTKDVLNEMNDWCKRQFTQNGLIEECLKSTITIEKADMMLNEFMINNEIKQGILAGNSISTDRMFLNKYCPKFVSNLHYRLVDVSSIKVLVDLWYRDRSHWNVETEHRGLSDIYKSIEELKYYKSKYFI